MNCDKCKNKKYLDRIYEVTICTYCINYSNFEEAIKDKKLIQIKK